MNEELQKENKRELNETEKDLQLLLKDADIDKIGEELLKEIEDANKTNNTTPQQDKIQTIQGYTGASKDALDTITQFSKKSEPYLLPFKIIIKRVDNVLSAIDVLIEYQKTGDGLKVIVKFGSEIIASQLFAIGTRIVVQAAISAFIATAIYTGSIILGVLAGVAIVAAGIAALWWINSKIEDWLKERGISFIDFMREFETHLSPEEKYYYNLAHCHKTQIRNMQKIQLYYNGKIPEDLKHYYFPFYDFKKAPMFDGKNMIKRINELQNNYKILSPKDTIDNININSELYLLKALYFCESFTSLNQNNQALLNTPYIEEKFPYNSSFYTIFISHKAKLNDTYLQARKELYKSINEFKRLGFKDLENAYQTYINSLIINEEINSKDETINENKEINKNLNQDENLNQESNTKENTSSTKEQDFNLLSSHSKNLNHFILENKDKNKRIIFLNNASSMSNLIHIYDNHCDIFIKNDSLLDIKRIEKEYDIKFKEFNTRVFFYEKLLLGAKENNEFSFEDKKENLLYHFKYDKEDLNSLGDLNMYYNIYNARIRNYSSDYCKYYCKIA